MPSTGHDGSWLSSGSSVVLVGSFTAWQAASIVKRLSLDPGANSGDVELFDVTIPGGFSGSSNPGNYTLTGGANGSDQNVIGTADFAVDVEGVSAIPEPSYGLFLVLGLALLTAVRWIAAGRLG
jgi:hypothetical protein